MRRVPALALCLALAAAPAGAHPHVFVDTGFELVFDGAGRLAAVRTAWVYDAFFSLLVIEDGGHDADGDGALSEAELAGLAGFDWPEGFEGDLEVVQGQAPARLGGPEGLAVTFRDGRLVTTHLRRLEVPLDPAAGEIALRPYDPGYYTAYTIVTATLGPGRPDCRAETWEPDLDAAGEALRAVLAEFAPGTDLEAEGYPAVGALFAEEVRLTCGG